MNLSTKQKEVIKNLRRGGQFRIKYPLLIDHGLGKAEIEGLLKDGILIRDEWSPLICAHYTLTHIGRTINID